MTSELPSLKDLGDDLLRTGPIRIGISLLAPFAMVGLYFWLAFQGLWVPAFLCVVYLSFCTYASTCHDLVHGALRLPRWLNDLLLSTIELLCLRSGFAYRRTHLHHHRFFPHKDDIEASIAYGSLGKMLLLSPFHQARLWFWSFRKAARRGQAILLLEAFLACAYIAFAFAMLPSTPAFLIYAILVIGGSWLYPLATVYLPHDPHGTSKTSEARMFRGRLVDTLSLGHLYHLEHHLYPAVPHQNWRELARRLDPHFARIGVKPVALPWAGWFRRQRKPTRSP
jgi:beta-carotene hydroxylase